MYRSRWAPKHLQNGYSKQNDDGSSTLYSGEALSVVSEQLSPTWSDPALKLIDEAANSMDIDFQPPTQEGVSISLVMDTNVLLSNLDVLQQFVEDLIATNAPVWVVIPGIVVQELDYQKGDTSRNTLCWSARLASTWILAKLKERNNLRGQSYQETLQRSGSWKKRDSGTSNDELIVDCCLFLKQKRQQNVLAISGDRNFCIAAECQGVPTMNPRDYTRWSGRTLAAFLFGEGFPLLNRFSPYREKFRPKNVRQAIDDELGLPPPIQRSARADDGMEIDDDFVIDQDPPPQHLLDDLHDQVLAHFAILLADLLRRVAPSMFDRASATAGSAKSIYADRWVAKPAGEWQPNEFVKYLCSARRMPPTAAAVDTRTVLDGCTRLADFFTPKYRPRGRSGQHWSRADWMSCLGTLGAVGRVYADEAIGNSLTQLAPQVEAVFESPMLPTGTG